MAFLMNPSTYDSLILLKHYLALSHMTLLQRAFKLEFLKAKVIVQETFFQPLAHGV